jgi:hypothetical protein
MNPLIEIATSSAYVAQTPQFWPSMGTIMAISVFIGAIIYDGQMREATRGIITLVSYCTLLFWMTISRVMQNYKPGYLHPEFIWAGAVTILITSLFFILGILLGVTVFKYKGWKK